MASKDWEAILYQLTNTASISDLIAKNPDLSPVIVFGNFEKDQTGMPRLSFIRLPKKNNYGIEDGFFRVNCYAVSQYVSNDIAEEVNNVFRSSIGDIDGYTVQTDSSILGSIPGDDCYNTPVEIRLIHFEGV